MQALQPDRLPAALDGEWSLSTVRARAATSGTTVKGTPDAGGTVRFAGASCRAARSWARSTIEVAIVGASSAIRHDRAGKHGAYAILNGRPRKTMTA